MKVKMLLVAAVMLVFASLSMAQTYPAYISWFKDDPSHLLTVNCDGTGGPIPDGTPIWVHQDTDLDGADTLDPLAQLCYNPPLCPDGPPGYMNVIKFYMNGNDPNIGLGSEGLFLTDYTVSQGQEPIYKRFFILIHYSDTTVNPDLSQDIHHVHWMTGITTLLSGQTVDVDCNDPAFWTCWESDEHIPPPITCTPDRFSYFRPEPRPYPGHGPQNFADCIVVCPGVTHTVCVGPLAAWNRIPRGFVFPGCEPITHPETPLFCDSICEAPIGWPVGPIVNWSQQVIGGQLFYCADLVPLPSATKGCLCVIVDFVLPVEMGEVAVDEMNGALKIKWNTLSETNLDHFAIYRDNVLRGTVTPNENRNYAWTESDLENFREYSYEIRTVDVNDVEDVVASVNGIPSPLGNIEVTEYALHQNYPNPFNPSTKIVFDVVGNDAVTLTIYNATGQLVGTLINGAQYANGRHSVMFDASNLTSGLYFYTVKIGNEFTATKKMLLVK